MFDDADLNRLIAAMRATGTQRLVVQAGEERLRLVLAPMHHVPAPPPPPRATPVPSPAIGTFLPRGADDGLPPLEGPVGGGEVLGYVLHGPVRWVVAAPAAGVAEPVAEGPVGFGDILFNLRAIP